MTVRSFRHALAASFFLVASAAFSQDVAKDWMHHKAEEGMYGVNTIEAYQFLKSKGKTAQPVIVGVIDSGTEVDHPDLKPVLWVNPNEIAGNGVDDDKNGYVDDVHGWDFIGGKDGKDVQHDTYEMARLYKLYSEKFRGVTAGDVAPADKEAYAVYQKVKTQYEQEKTEADQIYTRYTFVADAINATLKDMNNDNPTVADLDAYNPSDKDLMMGKMILKEVISQGSTAKDVVKEIEGAVKYYGNKSKYGLNLDFDPRHIVGDNYTDSNERHYGNGEVEGPDASHGTHVAGIIGAMRGNNEGMDGIADNVRILVVRAVPDGDERDKDVANAIRYAVDNGAKVINMSFGKYYVYDKKAVDEAVKYAQSKDVLLVHGAGNDSKNMDADVNYPNDQMADGTPIANWVNVGANDINGNTASFSNYGVTNVDVFAPGVDIYSTMTDQKYEYESGTSMASPVTAGVAALIRSYYPNLTAEQVKTILIKSCYKPKKKVLLPGSDKKKVKYSKLCASGGIVNAYKAVQLAEQMSSGK